MFRPSPTKTHLPAHTQDGKSLTRCLQLKSTLCYTVSTSICNWPQHRQSSRANLRYCLCFDFQSLTFTSLSSGRKAIRFSLFSFKYNSAVTKVREGCTRSTRYALIVGQPKPNVRLACVNWPQQQRANLRFKKNREQVNFKHTKKNDHYKLS